MIRHYRVFLASPGDTAEERIAAEEVIDEINKTRGARDNYRLELVKWETDTYSSVGEDGQDVINKQINNYQIFVGVMWKQYGSPTKRAGSGTEEEFRDAYERYVEKKDVHIKFYFKSAPIPLDADLIQAQKVKEFKAEIQDLGVYHKSYFATRDFEKQLRMDLQRHITDDLSSGSELEKLEFEHVIPEIKSSFKKNLLEIQANFSHSKVDSLLLEDIYIAPDVKELSNGKNTAKSKVKNLSDLTDVVDVEGSKYVFFGNDLSGKSTNVKYLFLKYFELGLYPVLLKGSDFNTNIRPESIVKIVENHISEQYQKSFSLSSIDPTRVIVLIDDFHKATKSKSRYWPALMKNLESVFNHIILTGDSLVLFKDLNRKDPFKNFEKYGILEFGPKFRYDLVNKWNTIGIESRFEDHNETLRKNDAYISHIKAIIGKNYIPSYPFYLLTILQALESGVQNPNYSIHGFYYEVLINECFSKAVKDSKEISLYYNYLTKFCFYLFEQGVKEISLEEFDGFHTMYCEKHDLSYSKESILQTFDSAKLLYVNNGVYIKESYVYYFFVAKFIANEIANHEEIKEIVTKMCERVFRDEYASIIMFVTHLSKDNFIINELTRIAGSLFPEANVAMLQDDIEGINQLVESIPEQVLEVVNVDDQRKEELEEEEESERLEKDLSNEKSSYDNFTLDDDITSIDFFARITRALKTIDILGQVAKKHWGELDGDQKIKLVTTTYNVGLKTLDVYLQMLQRNSKEIIEHISEVIKEKHFRDKHGLEKGIEEASKDFIFRLCFMSAFGVTKRISNAVGIDRLNNTFDKVKEAQPFNSTKLIDLAIRLGYSGLATNLEQIESYKEEMKNSNLSKVVLQSLVIDHMYMFDTDYKTRSRVCNKLGINVHDQLRIDQISTIKKKK